MNLVDKLRARLAPGITMEHLILNEAVLDAVAACDDYARSAEAQCPACSMDDPPEGVPCDCELLSKWQFEASCKILNARRKLQSLVSEGE